MARKKRYRIKFEFWINMDDPEQEKIADLIEHLKNNRAYHETIRRGLIIISELDAGRTEWLHQFYPWVAASDCSDQPQGELETRLAMLELAVLRQHDQQPVAAPIQPLRKISANHDDDDDLVEVRKRKSDGQSALNFLNSLSKLQ